MRSGLYEVQLTAKSAAAAAPKPGDKGAAKPDVSLVESRHFAYNVAPEEGDLKIVDGPQLETRLGGVNYHFHHASDAFFDSDDSDQASLSRAVLYSLIALLVCEQLLAYSCSYHPMPEELRADVSDPTTPVRRRGRARRRRGRRPLPIHAAAIVQRMVANAAVGAGLPGSRGLRGLHVRPRQRRAAPGVGLFLAIMRIAAFAGLLLFFSTCRNGRNRKRFRTRGHIGARRHQHQHGIEQCRSGELVARRLADRPGRHRVYRGKDAQRLAEDA